MSKKNGPIACTQFKFENLIIPPLESKGGGLFSRPTYKYPNGTIGELKIQFPISRTAYGFSSFPDTKDPKKTTESLSIDIVKGSEFEKFCEQLEIDIQNHSIKNVATVFPGKKFDDNIVRAMSNGVIRIPRDQEKAKNNPHTFKTSINEKLETPPKDGKAGISFNPKQFWSACTDSLKNAIPITSVSANSDVRLVAKLANYYVINGKYGFSWNLSKCEVMSFGDNGSVETDPNLYPEEACYIQKPPVQHIDDAYDHAMEAALAEAEKKRERSEEPEEEHQEEEEEQPKPAKKAKGKTGKK